MINTLLEKMLARSSNEWISKFRNVGLSCGRVNTMDRIFNHPQIKPRNMVAEVKHPNAKKVKLVGIPVKYSETPGSVRLPPLLLDQHHQEILQDLLCYSKEETEIFSHEDVIWSPFSISHTFI
ncbi:MAG: CoA transferase [Thermodesulfobacteriota bacterium]|nr:CoA transferase [Thermodesulfobacteriota bacterium]